MAERLACDLAVRGLIIFSGLARGVDTAAHRRAVNGKGKTVAMFGTGVDVMYPKENSRLAEQMLSLGRSVGFRVSAGNIRRPAKFSHPQPHYQRDFFRSARA